MRRARHRFGAVLLLAERALTHFAPDVELVLQVNRSSFQVREPELVIIAKVFEIGARRNHLCKCVLNWVLRPEGRRAASRRGTQASAGRRPRRRPRRTTRQCSPEAAAWPVAPPGPAPR